MTSEKKSSKRKGSAQYLLHGTLRRARKIAKRQSKEIGKAVPITTVVDMALKEYERVTRP